MRSDAINIPGTCHFGRGRRRLGSGGAQRRRDLRLSAGAVGDRGGLRRRRPLRRAAAQPPRIPLRSILIGWVHRLSIGGTLGLMFGLSSLCPPLVPGDARSVAAAAGHRIPAGGVAAVQFFADHRACGHGLCQHLADVHQHHGRHRQCRVAAARRQPDAQADADADADESAAARPRRRRSWSAPGSASARRW